MNVFNVEEGKRAIVVSEGYDRLRNIIERAVISCQKTFVTF